jgi:hypothetical protein
MDEGQQQEKHSAVDESAVDLHLERLSSLQKQLRKAESPHDYRRTLECAGSCLCHEVPAHAAALQAAAAAAAAKAHLDPKLLLEIIHVFGSLGATLIEGSHALSAHHAATQALHRCALPWAHEQ